MFYGRRLMTLNNLFRDKLDDGGGGDITDEAAKALGFTSEEDLEDNDPEDPREDGDEEGDDKDDEEEEEEEEGEEPEDGQRKDRLAFVQDRYQKALQMIGERDPDLLASIRQELSPKAKAKVKPKESEEEEAESMLDLTPSKLRDMVSDAVTETLSKRQQVEDAQRYLDRGAEAIGVMCKEYGLNREDVAPIFKAVNEMGYDLSDQKEVERWLKHTAVMVQNVALTRLFKGKNQRATIEAQEAARSAALADAPRGGAPAKVPRKKESKILDRMRAVRPMSVDELFDSSRRPSK